jgi:hypothetical protein
MIANDPILQKFVNNTEANQGKLQVWDREMILKIMKQIAKRESNKINKIKRIEFCKGISMCSS